MKEPTSKNWKEIGKEFKDKHAQKMKNIAMVATTAAFLSLSTSCDNGWRKTKDWSKEKIGMQTSNQNGELQETIDKKIEERERSVKAYYKYFADYENYQLDIANAEALGDLKEARKLKILRSDLAKTIRKLEKSIDKLDGKIPSLLRYKDSEDRHDESQSFGAGELKKRHFTSKKK